MTAIHYWISILAFDLLNKTIPVERNLTRESPLDLFYLMTHDVMRHVMSAQTEPLITKVPLIIKIGGNSYER